MYYLLRLDDASEYLNEKNWKRMERLCDLYGIKPIVGIIPDNQDPELIRYGKMKDFWLWVVALKEKGWTSALHGYSHVFETSEGGINPVNDRSEFAGVKLDIQKNKIRDGYRILIENGMKPDIFFAPAHTFDTNTILALKEETDIDVICDTVANNIYYEDGMFFIPQQSGRVRRLPFFVTTFCYHPNTMSEAEFVLLEDFLRKNHNKFKQYDKKLLKRRELGIYDYLLKKLYFLRR